MDGEMSILGYRLHFLHALRQKFTFEEVARRLQGNGKAPDVLHTRLNSSADGLERMWQYLSKLEVADHVKDEFADATTLARADVYHANIKNMIGIIKVPVGVVGPLRGIGLHANGDYLIPLATTEATLVASYNRRAKAHEQSRWSERSNALQHGITNTCFLLCCVAGSGTIY